MRTLLLIPLLFSVSLLAQETEEPAPQLDPAEAMRRSSLILGHQDGIRAAQSQMRTEDFDKAAFLKGFLMGLERKKLPFSPEEVREVMGQLQTKLTARETALAEENLKAETDFFEANRQQKGVIETESGLQYRFAEAGEGEPFGAEALAGKEILAHYRGTLPDGTEFVSSGETNPSLIVLDEVIAGFREALALMKPKSKIVIFVPSKLAYGDQRRSSEIGPNQMLIFQIELIEVRDPPATEE